MTQERVSAEDLRYAAFVLDTYFKTETDDPDMERVIRVRDWLDREVERRDARVVRLNGVIVVVRSK